MTYDDASVRTSEEASDEFMSFSLQGPIVYSIDATVAIYVAEDVPARTEPVVTVSSFSDYSGF
jgi:hypothetical protein